MRTRRSSKMARPELPRMPLRYFHYCHRRRLAEPLAVAKRRSLRQALLGPGQPLQCWRWQHVTARMPPLQNWHVDRMAGPFRLVRTTPPSSSCPGACCTEATARMWRLRRQKDLIARYDAGVRARIARFSPTRSAGGSGPALVRPRSQSLKRCRQSVSTTDEMGGELTERMQQKWRRGAAVRRPCARR